MRYRRYVLGILLTVVSMVLAGCQSGGDNHEVTTDGDQTGDNEVADTDDMAEADEVDVVADETDESTELDEAGGEEEGEQGANVIGPEGGSVAFGPWTLYFPPGVFEDYTEISGEPVTGAPANAALMGDPYTFSAGGLDIAGLGVQIQVTYDADDIPGGASEDDLLIAAAETGAWVALGSSVVDAVNTRVDARINTMTTFGLLPATAQDLEIPPILASVDVSTSALPLNQATPVTWTWTYRFPPSPEAACQIEGVGDVASGTAIDLTLAEAGQFVLTCANSAGDTLYRHDFAASVAPQLATVIAAPYMVPKATTAPVAVAWTFAEEPVPAPECTVNSATPTAEAWAVVDVSIGLAESQRLLSVTCTNNAGSDTQTVTVYGTVPIALPLTIPAGGGTFAIGAASLVVPADALTGDVSVQVTLDTTLPTDPTIIGLPLTITPTVYFQNPVSLTIPYTDSMLAMFGTQAEEIINTLGIASLGDNGEWKPLNTEIDTDAQTLTIRANRLSSFAITSSGYTHQFVSERRKAAETWQAKKAHPLRYAVNYLKQVDEMALGLPRALSSSAFMVYDNDTKQTPTSKTTLTSGVSNYANLGEKRWGAQTADFDDDGAMEMAVLTTYWVQNTGSWAVWYLRLDVYDDSAHNYARIAYWTSPASLLSDSAYGFHDADLDVVRIKDYSGVYHFYPVVTASFGKINNSNHQATTGNMVKSKLITFRVNSSSLTAYDAIQFPGGGYTYPCYEARSAAGDVEGDGSDELASTVQCEVGNGHIETDLWFWKPTWSNATTLLWNSVNVTRTGSNVMGVDAASANRPSVAMGDADVDFKDELFLTGYVSGRFILELWNVTYSSGKYTLSLIERLTSYADDGKLGNATAQMVVANTDTVRDEELYMLVGYQDGNGVTALWKLWWYDYQNKRFERLIDEGVYNAHLAAGDTDADGRKELALVYGNSDSTQYGLLQLNYESDAWSRSYTKTWTRSSGTHVQPFVALGDFDKDSTVVEYQNLWRAHETDYVPLTAIGAAPYWGESFNGTTGDRQDIGSCSSSVEFASSSGSSTSKSVGSSSEASISVSAGDPLGIVEVQAGVTLEQEFTQTKSNSKSTAYSSTFSCSAGNDCVVFQATTWDSYKYKVLAHPDSSRISKIITIDIPRDDPVMGIMTAADYNAENGNMPDIGAETFLHTAGCPGTYPETPVASDSLWKSSRYLTSRGGSVTASISDEVEESSEDARSWGVQLTFGVSIAGVEFSGSRGYSSEETYSYFMSESTTYSGTVGELLLDDWNSWKYYWGMYVRTIDRTDKAGMSYQVIEYWTESVPDQGVCGE